MNRLQHWLFLKFLNAKICGLKNTSMSFMKCTSICLQTDNGLYVPVIIRAFAWITYFLVTGIQKVHLHKRCYAMKVNNSQRKSPRLTVVNMRMDVLFTNFINQYIGKATMAKRYILDFASLNVSINTLVIVLVSSF
ncbi:hypothetical protein HanRHA438_Chr15g0700201 [Helianthus annuus]|uniref:Uncharacterized protein n=1 Tax=Helianthus annuus TaxID=4232 RepID=A0A251SBV4_HELAN|nr:hypothetical protein HanXRQr2_Chr15g0687921 [Helianthus annuus]KAJ0455115.1 hypothetical protein HanIR_Chr15g0747551 [Helianthus annuus]KAJ0844239.1 hypothetical protein HanRHA438_Chr15g0700201 [Helianthus annuus]